MNHSIERAIVELVREETHKELMKRVHHLEDINYRRLTYLLIEDRMALYRENGMPVPIALVLNEFGIHSPHTYYNWYARWHKQYLSLQKLPACKKSAFFA